jgi:hypothetical protein
MNYKIKLFLLSLLLTPALFWAQEPCEVSVDLPSYYICFSENGFLLPYVESPAGSYTGSSFVSPDGFFNSADAGPGIYSVIYVADPSVCIGSDTVEFWLLEPGILEVEGDLTICAGDSTLLSAPNGLEYDWLGNGERTTSFMFSPDSTTTYVIGGTDSNGCSQSQELTVSVYQSGPGVAITGPTFLCYGQTSEYEITGSQQVFWNDGSTSVSFETTFPSDTLLTVIVRDNLECDTTLTLFVDVAEEIRFDYSYTESVCAGDPITVTIDSGNALYYVVNGQTFQDVLEFYLDDDATFFLDAFNEEGCNESAELQFQVNDIPELEIIAPAQLCAYEQLNVSVSGAPSISWLNSVTGEPVELTGENEFSGIVTEPVSFEFTAFNEFGCVAKVTLDVPVYPLPDVRLDSLTPFCVNREATIVASGAEFYDWNIANTAPSYTFMVETNLNVIVVGTSMFGCVASDTLQVIAHDNPIVSLEGESFICELDTSTLVGSGAYYYFWDGVEGSDTLNATPSYDTLITMIGKNIFGCPDTATFFINVDPAPYILFIGDNQLCIGDSVSLEVQTDGLIFNWADGSTESVIPVNPSSDTSYVFTAIGENTCPRTSSFNVFVYDYPVLDILGSTTVCFGDSIQLQALGADSFAWNNGLTGESIGYVPVSSGILRVVGTSNECSTEEIIEILVNESPSVQFYFTADTLCSTGGSVSWVAVPAGGILSGDGIANNWFNVSQAISGVNTVTYTYTTAENCSGTATDEILVQTCTGIESELSASSEIYPNPFTNQLTISTPGESVYFEVIGSMGQLILSGQTNAASSIDTQSWAPGAYVVRTEKFGSRHIVKL